MSTPREFTMEECRQRFLEHVWHLIEAWDKTPRSPNQRDRLEGVAFSILAAIDGSAMALPPFVLSPQPHPEDKEFYQREGSCWWPSPGTCDIAGGLHEHFHNVGRKMGLLR